MAAAQQDSNQRAKQKCSSLSPEQEVAKRNRSPVPTISSAISIALHLVSPENGLYSLTSCVPIVVPCLN